jgi:hypothetical protein
MWGISLDTLLQIHVVISLLAIPAGVVVLYGLLAGALSSGWTALFLALTVLTSITGFPLPPFGFDPARAIGVLLLVLVAIAIAAFYLFHLSGAWRWVFIIAATIAFYLNCFVAVIQAFQKLAFLQPLTSAQTIVQIVVLLAFIALGALAVRRFHPKAAATT